MLAMMELLKSRSLWILRTSSISSGLQFPNGENCYHESQKRKGMWIKVPIEHAHLVKSLVKEGFRYRQMLCLRCLWLWRKVGNSKAQASGSS
ncbi:hypothetical protein EUGRSUZ_H00863 [Eucalyptus grandis]|uniref:Uncharacterized protein n=2 Tax=Eucalyptus grandis TaxID=71139 RepID=A0ACC3JM31_EUCGR|nr:hypothetical protein EUGRSUZ_H00863 [Eucalyptus grandis]